MCACIWWPLYMVPLYDDDIITVVFNVVVGPCRPSPVYCPTPPGWFGKSFEINENSIPLMQTMLFSLSLSIYIYIYIYLFF